MWGIVEFVVFGLIGLLSLTEFFIPLLLNKPFFGSFHKHKPVVKEEKPVVDATDLKGKMASAKEKVAEVKKVQDEIADFHKSAEQLKNESDDLLK